MSEGRQTAEGFLSEFGVAPAWFHDLAPGTFPQPTVSEGTPTWSVHEVQQWLRGQRLDTALTDATLADLRMLARRVRGESVAQIAASVSRSTSTVSERTRRAATQRVLQVEPEVLRVLAERRQAGEPDKALGSGLHVGRSLAQLALDGWRRHGPDRDGTLRRLWTTGQPVELMAERVGTSTPAVRKRLATLDLPPRLSRADIARRLGVCRATVTTFGVSKVLPQPAGRRANGRPWWWASDVDAWAAQNLAACPDCGARMVGLAQQRGRVHDRPDT